MYRIIGVDEKEYGPATAEQIRRWLVEGRVNGQTRVQREGSTEWQHLEELPEFVAVPATGRWTCSKCGEKIEAQFDSCWKCLTPRQSVPPPLGQPAEPPHGAGAVGTWRVEYRMFRGTFETWEKLFELAASFATEIGRERLIGISHSEDDDDGVVSVWYWTQEPKE
jgi:hypothetical protein